MRRRVAGHAAMWLVGLVAVGAGAEPAPRLVEIDADGQTASIATELILVLGAALPDAEVSRAPASRPADLRVVLRRDADGLRVQVERSTRARPLLDRRLSDSQVPPDEVAEAIALLVRSVLELSVPAPAAAPPRPVSARRGSPGSPPRPHGVGVVEPAPLLASAGASVAAGVPIATARIGARIALAGRIRTPWLPLELSAELELLAPARLDRPTGVHLDYRSQPVSTWVGVVVYGGPLQLVPAMGLLVERSVLQGRVDHPDEQVDRADWNAAVAARVLVRLRLIGRLWLEGGLRAAIALRSQHYFFRNAALVDIPAMGAGATVGLGAELP